MSFIEACRHSCFSNQVENLISKFKRSEVRINNTIISIISNPFQGDRLKGFGNIHLRKLRVPLKEYNIGKSGGLRIVYMVEETKKLIIMIAIYFKGDYKNENSMTTMIKENLRPILSSL